jgi:hypothetical protein
MRFFELENIAKDCNYSSIISQEGINDIIVAVAENEVYSKEQKEERRKFLTALKLPLNFIFYEWIMNDIQLKNALIHGILDTAKLKNKHYLLHAQKESFARFIGQFLIPILLEKSNNPKNEDMYNIIFFTQLLDQQSKILVQSAIKPYFDAELGKLKSKKDIAIGYRIQFLDALELFDRTFYSIVATYIKIVCALFLDQTVSLSDKQRLATAARRLQINQDHRDELNDFIKRAGISQTTKNILIVSRLRFLWGGLIIGSMVLLIYFLRFHHFVNDTNDIVIIPPYGTDSLTEEQITQLNKLFSLRADSINQNEEYGLDMDQFNNDTIQNHGD